MNGCWICDHIAVSCLISAVELKSGWIFCACLARSANLPKGLYICFLFQFFSLIFCYDSMQYSELDAC